MGQDEIPLRQRGVCDIDDHDLVRVDVRLHGVSVDSCSPGVARADAIPLKQLERQRKRAKECPFGGEVRLLSKQAFLIGQLAQRPDYNPELVSVARAYGEDVLRVWRRLVLLKQEGEQG